MYYIMAFQPTRQDMRFTSWSSRDPQLGSRSILFSAADINGDGRLDAEEFADILADPMDAWRRLESMGRQHQQRRMEVSSNGGTPRYHPFLDGIPL